jgi:hypothetical protein
MVEAEGAYLHVVRPDQIPILAISTELAAAAELDDPDYRSEPEWWTSRSTADSDGVPAGTAVWPGLRRVPVRDFVSDGTAGLEAGDGRDQGAALWVPKTHPCLSPGPSSPHPVELRESLERVQESTSNLEHAQLQHTIGGVVSDNCPGQGLG